MRDNATMAFNLGGKNKRLNTVLYNNMLNCPLGKCQSLSIPGVDLYRQQLEQVLNGDYKGSPFKIFETKIHAKYRCERFYPMETLRLVLSTHFQELQSAPQVPKLNQLIVDPKSNTTLTFHCYAMN